MKSIFWGLIMLVFLLGFALAIFTVFTVVDTVKNLPSPEQFTQRRVNQSTKIYDRTGEKLLYEVHGEEKRTVVPFEDIPLHVRQATLAAEDAHFYKNPAFDIRGILRAVINNLKSASLSQGGSTITQQLAKNVFLTREKTISRKLKELVIAVQFEERYTKDQILWFYLNQIPYGSNVYGIESAAQTFFSTSTQSLTLSQAATLSALLNLPSYYSPWGSHVDRLMLRKDYVLDRMTELGMISEEESAEAKKEVITFSKQTLGSIKAPHFVLAVKDILTEKYGEDMVTNGGLRVITTLDARLQEIAEEKVLQGALRNAELYKGTNAALVAQDPNTGQVLALVGSRNYFDDEIDGNFNVPLQGLRQPGSALKPFVYLTAFQEGYQPDSVVFDAETEFDASGIQGRSYKPHNFDDVFLGPVSLKESLAQSRNVPAVKTLYLAGVSETLKTLSNFGISTLTERARYGLSLVLGGGEIKLSELTNAYATLADDGVRHRQVLILEVRDSKGQALETYSDEAQRVIDPIYTRLVNSILASRELRAPLYSGSIGLTFFPGHDVALKTGTTNDYRDAWTMGYTPSLVVGVWAGNNNNAPMQKSGSSILAALPIWNAFMKEALQFFSYESFESPDSLPQLKKPMINGSPYGVFSADGSTYLRAHSILHYVDRSDPQGPMPNSPTEDPQYENWEAGVKSWVLKHLPNGADLTAPLPNNASIIDSSAQSFSTSTSSNSPVLIDPSLNNKALPVISDIQPRNSSFVGNVFIVTAKVFSEAGLKRVEVFLNGEFTAQQSLSGTGQEFKIPISGNLKPHNTLELRVFDLLNRETRMPLVIYH